MGDEDASLFGDLPRARRGTRSAKRAPAPAEPPPSAAGPPPRAPDAAPADDPVGDAVRGAVGVAGAGLRVANELTREVLRRLPRP